MGLGILEGWVHRKIRLAMKFKTDYVLSKTNIDCFVKNPRIVMPDLIRHPENIENTGFRLSPE
jgi:hypothetical protein